MRKIIIIHPKGKKTGRSKKDQKTINITKMNNNEKILKSFIPEKNILMEYRKSEIKNIKLTNKVKSKNSKKIKPRAIIPKKTKYVTHQVTNIKSSSETLSMV